MQSKDFISESKNSFRHLRKGKATLKTTLIKQIGISFPTWDKISPTLLSGPLKETPNREIVINPNYESFAGVYISKDNIQLSIVDFSGKQIHFKSQSFCCQISFWETLQEILKLDSSSNIKAVSICSDNYFDYLGNAKINNFMLLENRTVRQFIPEEIECYFEKTCITNSWKWYENSGVEDSKLNVVISFFEDYCYYTIMTNGQIIQKRRYCSNLKEADDFYQNVIFVLLKAINPDNMVFIAYSKDIFNLIKENISEWEQKTIVDNYTINQGFEPIRPTSLIVEKMFHPSESAAIHALYNYYGWTIKK